MSLIQEVDLLYERCVSAPDECNDQFFVDWADGMASAEEMDRANARSIRQCIRVGQRLAAFWAAADPPDGSDWRSRVDMALGARAWRPQLDLARNLLERHPSEEHYDAVAALFPLVHNEPFLDGASYEEWIEAGGNR